jgi:hypothetical protein
LGANSVYPLKALESLYSKPIDLLAGIPPGGLGDVPAPVPGGGGAPTGPEPAGGGAPPGILPGGGGLAAAAAEVVGVNGVVTTTELVVGVGTGEETEAVDALGLAAADDVAGDEV